MIKKNYILTVLIFALIMFKLESYEVIEVIPMSELILNQHPSTLTYPQKDQNYLAPLRQWLNQLEIRHEGMAHFLCQLIPTQCPFERDIYLLGRKIAHIPPLCKLNPLYEEVVFLRFRALCYLADECQQDVSHYC